MLKRLIILIVPTLLAISVQAQSTQQDDTTRDLWDTAFIKKRPPAKTQAARAVPVRYRLINKTRIPPARQVAGGPSVVGVTVWRLRPSKSSDEAEVRELIHRQGEWTPERVGGGTPLVEGSKVQLTIESPKSGYLYVFDREMFADNTFGEPILIFPTLNINGGDNKVSAGRVIEIPSADDNPPYYTLKRSRDDHVGESLTVIVSDQPLSDLTIGRGALRVSASQFAAYEKQWGGMTEQLELENGAGRPMSKAEKAAAVGDRELTQNDSPPQTIYRVQARPGQPLLLTIPLTIGSNQKSGSAKAAQ